MPEEKTLGSMIKAVRVARGTKRGTQWTQLEVAKRLGVSRVTYNKWENDVWVPAADDLKRIVALFSLSDDEAEELYRAASGVPPIQDNLPFPKNLLFTGRERILQQLTELLQGVEGEVPPVIICGLGGLGKTQIALEYAHRFYPKFYRVALWVNAANDTTLQSSFHELAHILNLPEKDRSDRKEQTRAVKRWLQEHRGWLLILDNADDLYPVRSFFPANYSGHILLTSQSQITGTVGERLELDAMKPAESLHFLLRRAGILKRNATLETVDVGIRELTQELVELLGGHPLALDQAGAYIEETASSIAQYLGLYKENRRYLLERRGEAKNAYGDHPESVTITFSLCFQKVRELYPLAEHILHFCAFLHPDTIPEEIFQHDEHFTPSTPTFHEGIAALRRYSLIMYVTPPKTYWAHLRTLSIHRLVQAVLVDSMDTVLQRQWKERVLRVLTATFPDRPSMDAGKYERLSPHMLVCATWEDDVVMSVEVANLFRTASMILMNDGYSTEAEMLREHAFSIVSRQLGDTHPSTMQLLNELASFYIVRGDDEKAEKLFRNYISLQDVPMTNEHPNVVPCLRRWAFIHLKRREYEQAAILLERGLAIQEAYLDIDNFEIGKTACTLAILYYLLGRKSEASSLYWRAIHIWDSSYVEERDVEVALFGDELLRTDDPPQHDKAVALYRRALDVYSYDFNVAGWLDVMKDIAPSIFDRTD